MIIGHSRTVLRRSRRRVAMALDFRSARDKLKLNVNATDRHLLGQVSLCVSPDDDMYRLGDAEHYLSVGLSAIRCISRAVGESKPRSILDFPCGYGRVLRFLRVKFPDAAITVGEIAPQALTFCGKTFGVKTLSSSKNLGQLRPSERFDLIWCGSLLTHINEASAVALLKFFCRSLSIGGKCVFSTHGAHAIKNIENGHTYYGLTDEGARDVVTKCRDFGYGYRSYPGLLDYGISVISRKRVKELAASAGEWRETAFLPAAWDAHHDIHAWTLFSDNRPISSVIDS